MPKKATDQPAGCCKANSAGMLKYGFNYTKTQEK